MNLFKTLPALALVGVSTIANAGLVVTQTDDANALVNTLNNGLATSGLSTTGASDAFGTFTGGLSAGLGFDSGIILSTGNVTGAVGPNTANDSGFDFNGAGDSDLDAMVPGFSTFDAAILKFSFTSTTGSMFFNYIFASEEYPEFVDQGFNDVFAFLVDGVNVANVPGSSSIVGVDTVNPNVNSQFYNNNHMEESSDPFAPPTPVTPSYDIAFDGFTDVFTAEISGLNIGQTYEIEMKIADVNDGIYDSAVFIESASFSDFSPNEVPEPAPLALMLTGLAGLLFARKRQH